MAEAKIQLGGVLDIASGDELSKGFDRMHDAFASSGKPKRIMRPLSRAISGLALANGQSTHLFIGRPSAGRVWIPTRLTVLSTSDFDSATGIVAAFYIGDDQSISITQCVLDAQQVPFTTTQNEHAWVCTDKESLFLNITATAANTVTQIVANTLVWEYKDSDVLMQAI